MTTFFTVPGSTVLRTTMVWRLDFSRSTKPISRHTDSMYSRPRSPFFLLGVPTQIIDRSLSRMAAAKSVVPRRRPVSMPCCKSASSPGSTIGDLPWLIRSILVLETSTPITS
ncbi:hypothetical protein D3C79_857070 [compost metagenome]